MKKSLEKEKSIAWGAEDSAPNLRILETLVVEGKDDVAAVKAALSCSCIVTHGHGFGEEKLQEIEEAARRTGIIIFTDPDYAGKRIRQRIQERIPNAKHAYLNRDQARKGEDLGVENASPEAIRQALKKAHACLVEKRAVFSRADLLAWGLDGAPGAKEKRIALARILGIGYGNAKRMLSMLNDYGLERQEVLEALQEIGGDHAQ